jgi:hypothetical protein
MNEEIIHKIRRIYAAIGAAEQDTLQNVKATVTTTVTTTEMETRFSLDFGGEFTEEELSNITYSVIDNISYLRDHLQKWVVTNGKDKKRVDEAIDRSPALLIIRDLSNNNKHGYPPSNGRGYSGKAPRLGKIDRSLQLAPGATAGSVEITMFDLDGTPKVSSPGSDTLRAITTGEVFDKDNNRIGDLNEIAAEAVQAWEQLLEEFGIEVR